MSSVYEYEKVEPEFIESGEGAAFDVRVELPCSAETLFKIFEDADAWCEWLGCTQLVWTSELGPNTTRDITLFGNTVSEQFFAWEPGRRMAFRIDRGTDKRMQAFAESFDMTPITDSSCELHYYGRIRLAIPRVLWRGVAFGFELNGRRVFKRLRRLIEERGSEFEVRS